MFWVYNILSNIIKEVGIMRFLHTSDWHLGISMNNISMLDEQRYFAENLTKVLVDKNIDALIVAGDVFDSSVSNSDAISLYNDIATQVCLKLNIPMLVIAGNHDGAARLASMNELLKNSGMYVSGKLTKDIKPISFDDADIYLIPFFNIDEVRYLYPEKNVKSYDSAMNIICDNIRANMNRDKTNIVISHSFVGGATLSDSERSATVGTVNIVSKDAFRDFSYVALGHIHKKQKLADNIYYSGSPVKYSIKEAAQNKYMLIYDSSCGIVEEVNIIPFHDTKIIEGEYEHILAMSPSDDYVKVVITDKYIGIDILDTLRNMFPNLVGVEGKSVISDGNLTSLTMEQVRNMSPAEIIQKFFEENFNSEFEQEQLHRFLQIIDGFNTEELS